MKVASVAVLCAFACVAARGQPRQSTLDESTLDQLAVRADNVFLSLVELRRDIHQNPELSGREERTSGLIDKYLRSLGLEVESNVGGFGVVGILRGAKPGPVVAWRADMDALADNSPDAVDFRTVNPGVKHACGHDVHTAIGLGIANVLSSVKDRLSGTVLFTFQPAEENFTGAKAMIDAGLFYKLKPDAVFSCHLAPLPAGIITTKPKEIFACRAEIDIELKNITDEEEVLRTCSGFLKELNTPRGTDIFSVPLDGSEKGLFNRRGTLAHYFALSGACKIKRRSNDFSVVASRVFASSDSVLASAVARLREDINRSQLKEKVLRIRYSYLQPPVMNDPGLTARSMGILQAKYGKNRITPLYGVIPGFNDDFAFFQRETRGVYFLLGGSNVEKGIVSMPHSPNFAVDEECIKKGVTYFSSLLFELTRHSLGASARSGGGD